MTCTTAPTSDISQCDAKTQYGVAVILLTNDGQVLLSRRSDMPSLLSKKKWQIINDTMYSTERSSSAAVRVVKSEVGIYINEVDLSYIKGVYIPETNEFYYIYMVGIAKSKIPDIQLDMQNKHRGDWRWWKLEKSLVLDVISGTRPILRGLYKSFLQVHHTGIH